MQVVTPGQTNYVTRRNVLTDQFGTWFSTEHAYVVTVGVQLNVGAGPITGELVGEFTASPSPGPTPADPDALSPVLLPEGSLHSALVGVQLASPVPDRVLITDAAEGGFTVSFSAPLIGRMRFGWRYISGAGGGHNTISIYTNLEVFR